LLAILNYEEDIAMYTIKVANDSRAHNRIVVYRPSKNIITQNELISLWEHKNGQIFNKVFVPEEDIIKLSQSKTLLHSIFSFRFEYKKKNNFLISLMNKTCI
jgi:hypothetical protein